METREIWAHILKFLRENGENILLSAISNLQIIFTRETITIISPNSAVYDLLIKHQSIFDTYAGKSGLVNIKKVTKQEKPQMTLEQKLAKIFGDKLIIEV